MNPNIPIPPKEIFAQDTNPFKQVAREKNDVFWIDRTECPDEGGIYIYKFGAEPLTSTVTPKETEEYEKKGEEILLTLKKLLDDVGFVLIPNGNQVNLVPLKIFEANQLKPNLDTRIDTLYPEKGFPTPEALWACNLAKRFLIRQVKFLFEIKFSLLFLPNKLKKIDDWLYGYNKLAKMILAPYYLKDIRYSAFCRELRTLIGEFLKGIGFLENTAESFARTFSTLIEYDTAYRYRIEDILSETTYDKLKITPRSEIKRLLGVFAQRENKPHLVQKFKWIGLGLSFALLIPKIKRAFNKALDQIDFTKLQLDEADRYHVLRLDGYEFMGRTIEDRIGEYVKRHNGNPPIFAYIQAE
jgi:hypothetical protein